MDRTIGSSAPLPPVNLPKDVAGTPQNQVIKDTAKKTDELKKEIQAAPIQEDREINKKVEQKSNSALTDQDKKTAKISNNLSASSPVGGRLRYALNDINGYSSDTDISEQGDDSYDTGLDASGDEDEDYETKQENGKSAQEKNLKVVIEEDKTLQKTADDQAALSSTPLTLDQIQALAKNGDANASTHEILTKIMQGLNKIYENKKIKITYELNRQGDRLEVEPFKFSSDSSRTGYKIGVSYTIEVEGQDLKIEPLKREIFTSATNPGQTGAAAAECARTFIRLAKYDYRCSKNETYKGLRFGGSEVNEKQRKELMGLRNFQLKFSYDAAGNPLSLTSIQATTKSGKLDFNLATNSNKEYYYESQTNKVKHRNKNDARENPKEANPRIYYGTEEEAYMNARYVVKNEKDSLTGSLEYQIEELKEKTKEIERELDEVRATFEKQPLIRFFGAKAKETTEFKEYLENLKIDIKDDHQMNLKDGDQENLTANMRAYIKIKAQRDQLVKQYGTSQKDDLAKLEGIKKKLTADPSIQPTADEIKLINTMAAQHELEIKDFSPINQINALIHVKQQHMNQILGLDHQIEQLKEVFQKEQEGFNRALNKLQELTKDLERQIDLLSQAEFKFSKKEIERFNVKKEESFDFIRKVLARLELIDANKQENKAPVVVGDNLENVG